MFKKLLLLVWVSLVVFAVSCKGPEGDVGPAGPKGDTGATGPQGPAGEDGTSSGAIILSTGADSTDENGDYINGIPDLTAELDSVLQASAVLVYIKSGDVFWPLPGIVGFGDNAVSNFTFVHGIQQNTFFVQLFQTAWSEDQDAAPVRAFEDVRIVIIPGFIQTKMNAELLKSYDKTIAALGLTEKDVRTGKKLNLKITRK